MYTPNPPTNIVPTNIARLKLSGNFPMGLGIPPLGSQNFKLSVSNLKSKYVAYVSVLSQISNCQGLGRKTKHDNLKTDRMVGSLHGRIVQKLDLENHLLSNETTAKGTGLG